MAMLSRHVLPFIELLKSPLQNLVPRETGGGNNPEARHGAVAPGTALEAWRVGEKFRLVTQVTKQCPTSSGSCSYFSSSLRKMLRRERKSASDTSV